MHLNINNVTFIWSNFDDRRSKVRCGEIGISCPLSWFSSLSPSETVASRLHPAPRESSVSSVGTSVQHWTTSHCRSSRLNHLSSLLSLWFSSCHLFTSLRRLLLIYDYEHLTSDPLIPHLFLPSLIYLKLLITLSEEVTDPLHPSFLAWKTRVKFNRHQRLLRYLQRGL